MHAHQFLILGVRRLRIRFAIENAAEAPHETNRRVFTEDGAAEQDSTPTILDNTLCEGERATRILPRSA